MKPCYIVLPTLLLYLVGCEKIAILATPKKKPIKSSTELASKAKENFWFIFHHGHYERIAETDALLMESYLANPNDPQLARYLGALHTWKITERQRETVQNPLVVNEIILAKKYFSDALVLDPHDAFSEGLLGDAELIEGQIFNDAREQVQGYFTLQQAISHWPEFNYFTAGYPMKPTLSPQSRQFKDTLNWLWKNMDVCAGETLNRKNPDLRPYMSREVHHGKQRACWNSWTAPYNFEGVCMDMGDILVKAGDWQTGIIMYQNAKLAENYSSWPYRYMLERRIQNAKENVIYFQQDNTTSDRSIMFNSGYGCMACHQQGTNTKG